MLKLKLYERQFEVYDRTGYPQDAAGRPLNGLFQVSIVKDDVRAFAAQLERHYFQVRPGRRLLDLPPSQRTTCEGNLLDDGMFSDRLADGGTYPTLN